MLERSQLFPLAFYKKAKFNGSQGNMHFRLEKKEVEISEEEKKTIFLGTTWEGPYCYDVTDKEQMTTEEFSFSEDGICKAMDWLNEESKRYNL